MLFVSITLLCSVAVFAAEQSESLSRSYVSIARIGRSVAMLTADARLSVGRLDDNNELVDVRSYDSIAVIGSNSDGILVLDYSQRLWMIRENLTIRNVTRWPDYASIQCIAKCDDSSVIVSTWTGVVYQYTPQQDWKVIDTSVAFTRMEKVGSALYGSGFGTIYVHQGDSSFMPLIRNVISFDVDQGGLSAIVVHDVIRYILTHDFSTGFVDSALISSDAIRLVRVGKSSVVWSQGKADVYNHEPKHTSSIYPQRTGPIVTEFMVSDGETLDSSKAMFVGGSSGVVVVNATQRSFRILSHLETSGTVLGEILQLSDGSILLGGDLETMYRSTNSGTTWTPHRRTNDKLYRIWIENIWPQEQGSMGYVSVKTDLHRYFNYGDSLVNVGLSGTYFEFLHENLLLLGNRRIRLFDSSLAVLADTILDVDRLNTRTATNFNPEIIVAGSKLTDTFRCGSGIHDNIIYRYRPDKNEIDSVMVPGDGISFGVRYLDEMIFVTFNIDSNCRRSAHIRAVDRHLNIRTITDEIEGVQAAGLRIDGSSLLFAMIDRVLRIDLVSGEILDTIVFLHDDWFMVRSLLPVGDSILLAVGSNSLGAYDVRSIRLRPSVTGIRSNEIATTPTLYVGSPYPMPTSSTLSIPTEWNMVTTQPANIGVYDVTGRPAMETQHIPAPTTHSHTITIDVSGLPSGIYYVRIERQGQSFTRVICRY